MSKYILKLKTTGAGKGASAGFLKRKEKLEKWNIVKTKTKNYDNFCNVVSVYIHKTVI